MRQYNIEPACQLRQRQAGKEQGIKNIKQSTPWKFSFEYNDEEEWMIYETQPCTMTYQIFFNLVGLTE